MESLTNNKIKKKNDINEYNSDKNNVIYQSKIINPTLPEKNNTLQKYEIEENNIKNSFSFDNASHINLNEKSQNIKNEIISFKQLEISYNELITHIIEGNLIKIQEILKQNPFFINKISKEGLTPLQYCVLYSDILVFKKLIEFNADTNVILEGMYIIHLSLIKCIFKKEQKRCSDMFHFIIENYPEQKNYVDRLGRTYLHIIFQFDFSEALKGTDVLIDELFKIDNNGDYVINYVYKYNSNDSFTQICENFNNIQELYLKIRVESKLNQGLYYKREEVFFEKCAIHHAYEIMGFLVLNSTGFDNEIEKDMKSIIKKYSNITDNDTEDGVVGINSICVNVSIALQNWEKYHSRSNNNKGKIKFDFKFNVRKTGIVYNKNCLFHLNFDDSNKNNKKILQLKDIPDRFSVLINDKGNGILNSNLFDSSRFIFIESKREGCLNDILKCHDISYLQSIKKKCDNISKKNSLKNNNNINNNNIINNNEIKQEEKDNNIIEKLNSDTYISKDTFNIMTSQIGSIFDAIDYVISGECTNAFVIIRPPGHNAGYFGPVENNNNNTNNCIINNACIGAAYARYKYRNNGISKIAIFDYNAFCGKGSEEIIQMLHSKVFSKDMDYDKVGKINIRKDKNINWLNFDDSKNILYISTHIQNNENNYFGNNLNNTKEYDDIYPAGILNIPFNSKKVFSYEFRNVIRSKVIPRLCKFKPDLIILCSGFDGHELEENGNQMYLQEYDYAFLTEQLQFVSDNYSKRKLVSILEEGYNVKSGIVSSFAQCVFTHVRYLNLAANMDYIFDVKKKKNERKSEYENDLENFKKIERFSKLDINYKNEEKNNIKEENIDININNINYFDHSEKYHSHTKNSNYKNISEVPKNLIKSKLNHNI